MPDGMISPTPKEYLLAVERRFSANATRTISLCEILPKMRGAPPELVAELCSQRLKGDNAFEVAADLELEPHPLDYDWRFTAESRRRLASVLQGSSEIVLCGAPSLAPLLRQAGKLVYSIDQNPAYLRTAFDFACDCVDKICGVPFSSEATVLMDPPWYLEDTIAWLRNICADALPRKVIFSVWPELVRPQASSERATLFQWLSEWAKVKVEENGVSYTVPEFERLAYREQGICLPPVWRHGDLVTITPSSQPKKLNLRLSGRRNTWVRFNIGRRQIAIRDCATGENPKLAPLPEIGFHLAQFYFSVDKRNPVGFRG